jgi:hypothetical protein
VDVGRILISHRLLIDEQYAGPLRDWLGDFRPGSLLILDEVDRRVAFVTSANVTEAAQERNIEAGVVVHSPRFAARLADHFDALAEAGLLRRLTLLP